MEEKKRKLVIDGNAFYELDLECLRKKKEKNKEVKRDGRTNNPLSRNQKTY